MVLSIKNIKVGKLYYVEAYKKDSALAVITSIEDGIASYHYLIDENENTKYSCLHAVERYWVEHK
jgi:hypothetical protein